MEPKEYKWYIPKENEKVVFCPYIPLYITKWNGKEIIWDSCPDLHEKGKKIYYKEMFREKK
jgi:hypothetical protein